MQNNKRTTLLDSLRQQIKKKLRNQAPDLCLLASQKIKTKITASDIFIRSRNIACYISIDNEIDVWPIIETIWSQGKTCYLPICDSKIKNPLRFIKFFKHDKLTITKHKTLEPKTTPTRIVAPQKLDLAIMPLLGFNNNRFRLGRGAGCYDRTFAFKQQNPQTKPYLLGVGYEWQLVDFDPNPLDVVMDEVVF